MSIPEWSYTEEYYASLLDPFGLRIITDPIKGKGLFTARKHSKGDVVLKETALCCTQNLDDFRSSIPVCATCMRSVESPAAIIRRLAKASFVDDLPAKLQAEAAISPSVPCRQKTQGCNVVYCSIACEEKGWMKFHSVWCQGIATDEAKVAFKSFLSHAWIQGGIDLSDTHWLAFRFVALFISRHREGQPLEQAWSPIGQLIRAPITKFAFTYLVADEYETEVAKPPKGESKETRLTRRWNHFLKYKKNQSEDPIVKHATTGNFSKSAMISEGLKLVRGAFAMTTEEADFLTATRWSELLGTVLLNGQERSPNSPFFELREENKSLMSGFLKKLKSSDVNHRIFDTSTRGQGIYTVGACFNHSCSPNIQVSYNERNDETLVVLALRDIAAGEELCISYIDENAPFEERQQHLFEHYLFDCGCAKCISENLGR